MFCVVFQLNVQTTSGDDVRDFAKQMKNKITRKYRRKPHKKSYLDYPTTREGGGTGEWVQGRGALGTGGQGKEALDMAD